MSTFLNLYVQDTADVKDLTVTGSFGLASINLSATSNQIVAGTGQTVTLTAPTPAASSVYTIPDVGTTGSFIMSTGSQVIAGVKTLTTPEIFDTSADHKYSVAVSELVADRTVTLPLLGTNDTFVFESHGATLSNKILSSPTITGVALADNGSASAPSYAFTNATDTGLYRPNPGILAVAAGGVTKASFTSEGLEMTSGQVLSVAPLRLRSTTTGANLAISSATASCIRTTAGLTVTLPTGGGFDGNVYRVIRGNAAGDVIISASGADTIDDGSTTSITLTNQYQRVTLQYFEPIALWAIV